MWIEKRTEKNGGFYESEKQKSDLSCQLRHKPQ